MYGGSWPSAGTQQASFIVSLWLLFCVVAACVAAIVLGLIIFAALRWRRRSGDGEPAQFENNVPIELAWTAVPLVLVAGLFLATYKAEAGVDALSARPAVVVAVTGFRWGWTFAYEGGPTVSGASQAPPVFGRQPQAPELVIPAGETTRVELTGADVIHGFWIPDFLFKRDAIPGQTTAFDLRPKRVGTFLGRCSAFCGLQHERMYFTVRVVTPPDFARWRAAKT